MKKYITLIASSLLTFSAFADDIEVQSFNYAGPYILQEPVMMDSVDVNSKRYGSSAMLNTSVDLIAVENGVQIQAGQFPGCDNSKALHLVGFTLSNTIYTDATVTVDGLKHYQVYVDGKQVNGGHTSLVPTVHKVVIKYMSEPDKTDSATVHVDGKNLTIGVLDKDTKRPVNLSDAMNAKNFVWAQLSPNGRYLIYNTAETVTGGTKKNETFVKDLQTGNIIDQRTGIEWMPRTNKYVYTKKNDGVGYTLIAVDPATHQETVINKGLPQNSFTLSPTEDYIIYSIYEYGPKESKDVYEVVMPDDRQPGWRNRYNLCKYDFKSGMVQQLTYGHHNVYLNDISSDGKYILISKSESRLEARPTTVSSLYCMNLETHKLDTLINRDGFFASASFSPDGKYVMVSGSPEALDGIGKNVNDGQTPNMFDYQLYLSPEIKEGADYSPKAWKAMTRDFNPNVTKFQWSEYDGMVYMVTEDKDCLHVYRMNPKTGKIQYIECGEEVVRRVVLASAAPVMSYYGQGASNPDRLYVMNTKSLKRTVIGDVKNEKFESVEIGKCEAWTYVNESGDSVLCRFYVPSDFDASKKYPMIVNYYGGCSPTSRDFLTRYPQHAYASLGYVVLVVNPHGATGFGQKWSAAHVNTAGKGVAEDIIGAVKTFCKEHSFVDDKKIGCIGASYGGFMTQYLQTVTDIFAAAVSHAGISDHTSYWGEGYWGYSYSETSMANSYPWTRKDLYVDQSPLYNADKVHTPLLFVHGTSDTNVPVGESIQMYTALKLLGRPTAMVLVEGENHWIVDYNKRVKWQNTIWAWFAKYLQGDESWWNSMYGKKDL